MENLINLAVNPAMSFFVTVCMFVHKIPLKLMVDIVEATRQTMPSVPYSGPETQEIEPI